MPRITMTHHLYRYFPHLEQQDIQVAPGSVADCLQQVNALAPGFTDYVLDEHGAQRRHVKLCINDALVIDRRHLSDHVKEGDTLYIFQALSGG